MWLQSRKQWLRLYNPYIGAAVVLVAVAIEVVVMEMLTVSMAADGIGDSYCYWSRTERVSCPLCPSSGGIVGDW